MQFARGFCGSRVTVSLRETGGSHQSTRDFSWNRDGLDSYGVAASSEEDFGAQRLDKGLAGAEVVPEEGAAVFGRELQHACKVVKPGRSFLRRMFELLAGVHMQGPPPHQIEHLLPFGLGLVGYVSGGVERKVYP